jgi:hypothetical protein
LQVAIESSNNQIEIDKFLSSDIDQHHKTIKKSGLEVKFDRQVKLAQLNLWPETTQDDENKLERNKRRLIATRNKTVAQQRRQFKKERKKADRKQQNDRKRKRRKASKKKCD